MFKIIKVLNHNGVMAIDIATNNEYILLGKGIGFGKKVNDIVEKQKETQVYLLQEETSRGLSKDIINNISPEALEIANSIIVEAKNKFGDIDKNILCPLSDHIDFAIKRIENNEQISNPLTQDIKALFLDEYEVANKSREIFKRIKNIEISEDEVGYIALHIHSALGNEKISQAMQLARIVRVCIGIIENGVGKKIDVDSLSYNRLMSHIKYMTVRTINGEPIKLDMNDYIKNRFPNSFIIAEEVCNSVEAELKKKINLVEIGYLAMHIERVFAE